MIILRKLYVFHVPIVDLIRIYIIYIRSLLEQSCVVWHISLTQEDSNKLERVQKVALRIILKDDYTSYDHAIERTKLETLEARRIQLCLKFAQSCTKNENTKWMFPVNLIKCTHKSLDCQQQCECQLQTRNREKYKVQKARTDRLQNSSIPYMQRLLNMDNSNSDN